MRKLIFNKELRYCNECPFFTNNNKIIGCIYPGKKWDKLLKTLESNFEIPKECCLPVINKTENNMNNLQKCFHDNIKNPDSIESQEIENTIISFLDLFLPWFNKKDYDFRNDESANTIFKYFLLNSKEGDRDER